MIGSVPGRSAAALLSLSLIVACAISPVPTAAQGGPAPAAAAKQSGPRIKSGIYGSGDVQMEVNVKARRVYFHFYLFCRDPFASQYVGSGPRPVGGALKGNRRGATVYVDGDRSGAPESGVGTDQDVFWTMAGNSPARPTSRGGWNTKRPPFPNRRWPGPSASIRRGCTSTGNRPNGPPDGCRSGNGGLGLRGCGRSAAPGCGPGCRRRRSPRPGIGAGRASTPCRSAATGKAGACGGRACRGSSSPARWRRA